MTPEARQPLLVDSAKWTSFFEELAGESERAAAILVAAWIDELLKRKLAELFLRGNSEARDRLFKADGPFASFAAKINAAFCAGWLDSDVHHDLGVIRKIRNEFAHKIHGLSMESPEIRELVESFRVPHREYYDWGKLKCAAIKDGNGIAFYTDQPPENAGEQLNISTACTFRWAASWVVAYLFASLDVGIILPDDVQISAPEDFEENS